MSKLVFGKYAVSKQGHWLVGRSGGKVSRQRWLEFA